MSAASIDATGDTAVRDWNRLEWATLDAGARERALTRPVQVVARPRAMRWPRCCPPCASAATMRCAN